MEHGNSNNGGTALAERSTAQQVPVARREIRVVEDSGPLANLMDTARFEHLQRIANLMANSSLLPEHLRRDKQGELPRDVVSANCFRVCNQALRWGFDPFAIVDETYMVSGKLGYQGKLVAAVINARAGLTSRLSYEFSGAGDGRTVRVVGRFAGEDVDRDAVLVVRDAATQNQMWKKDPDQKLIYSGVVKWARRHCPEVVLGVLTDDDIERMAATMPTAIETPRRTLDERLATARAAQVVAATHPDAAPVATNAAPQADAAPGATAGPDESQVIDEADVASVDAEPPPAETDGEAHPADERFPKTMPAEARKGTQWIDNVVLLKKPEGVSKHQAVKAFHGFDVGSWASLSPARQDAKFNALLDDTIWG